MQPKRTLLFNIQTINFTCRVTHKAQQKATTLGAALSALVLAGLVLALVFINCTFLSRWLLLLPDLLCLPCFKKNALYVHKGTGHPWCCCTRILPCAWHAGHDTAGSGEKRLCTPPGADARIAFFGDLHGFTHPILTAVPKAQRLFDQA